MNTNTANNSLWVSKDRGIQHKNSSTGRSSFWVKPDGSGQLGYVNASSTNPAIRWDKNGVLAIDPSLVPSGGGTTEDTTGIFTDMAFKTTTTNVAPTLPGNDWPLGADESTRSDGWARYAQNSDGSKIVWMATRKYNTDGQAVDSNWYGPWQITGPKGEAGADGKDIEFVYTRTATSAQPTAPLNADYGTAAFQRDDYYPTGWNDNAAGVTDDMPYEWIGIRTKTDDTWSQFHGPILWSHWGQNGMDGDGIEYIYYANTSGTIPANQNPKDWDISPLREYTGPSNSLWTDNPWDLESLGQGAKEWVSVRKRDGETGLWSEFSEPALWASIARDGIANGFIVDLTNGNMPVGTNSAGAVVRYMNKTDVQVFHNGERESATVTVGDIWRSDNRSVSSADVTCAVDTSTTNSLDKTVTVNITSLTDFAGVNLFIPLHVTLSDDSVRTIVITCYGTVAGADGKSIELGVNTHAIRYNYRGSVVAPTNVEVWAAVNSGQSSMPMRYFPDETDGEAARYTFDYAFDNNSNYTELTTRTIAIGAAASMAAKHTVLTVRLKVDGVVYDVEDIYFVSDGQSIEGKSATNYTISPIYSNMTVNSSNKINGVLRFIVTKKTGDQEAIVINRAVWDDGEFISVKANGSTAQPTYDSANSCWYIEANGISLNQNESASASITVFSAARTPLTAIVVPFIMSGTEGVRGDFKSTAFTRYNGDLSSVQPTGGSYTNPIPNNSTVGTDMIVWSDDIPNGDYKLWATTRTFKGDNQTSAWSTPRVMTDTDTYDVEFSSVENNPGNPTDNPNNWKDPNDITDWSNIIWRAEREKRNGVYVGDWIVLRIKGEKGEDGTSVVQGLDGIVMRFSSVTSQTQWDYNKVYSDGSQQDNGVRYKDIVYFDGSYWTPSTYNPQELPSDSNNSWVKFNMVDAAYIEDLITDNAFINNLTAKQIVLTNGSNQVVGGMVSGSSIPTQLSGRTNEDNVRIFAGSVPSTGNIAASKFAVFENGTVKAGTSTIYADGSGSLAGGNITWNTSGDITANSITIDSASSRISRPRLQAEM